MLIGGAGSTVPGRRESAEASRQRIQGNRKGTLLLEFRILRVGMVGRGDWRSGLGPHRKGFWVPSL